MTDDLKILAVTRKPNSASFEQRVLNHIEPLAELGVKVTWRKIPSAMAAQRQFLQEAASFDGLWWHRYMLSVWKRNHFKAIRCPIVFDFDDPLVLSSRRGGRPSLTRRMRFATTLRRCDAAFAASTYLRQLALPYCSNIYVQPMAVDLPQQVTERSDDNRPIELLWIGGRSTQVYLPTIGHVLQQLGSQRQDVRLRLVAHQPMTFDPMPVDFRQWSPKEQEAALQECDIGLCPMPDTPWTRGKCPYKILQYMACAMPWVGSAVGENIVAAGEPNSDQPVRGLCASDESQWLNAINRLLDGPQLRHEIGQNGRDYVESEHNRPSVADRLAQAWRQIIDRNGATRG